MSRRPLPYEPIPVDTAKASSTNRNFSVNPNAKVPRSSTATPPCSIPARSCFISARRPESSCRQDTRGAASCCRGCSSCRRRWLIRNRSTSRLRAGEDRIRDNLTPSSAAPLRNHQTPSGQQQVYARRHYTVVDMNVWAGAVIPNVLGERLGEIPEPEALPTRSAPSRRRKSGRPEGQA